MSIQFLKDKDDKTIAVVIPISDWEEIIKTHPDIDLMLQPQTNGPKTTMKDFRGCISSETEDKLNFHIQQSRNEWERDF